MRKIYGLVFLGMMLAFGTIFAAAPMSVTIQNDTDLDIDMASVFSRNLDEDDVGKLEAQTLFAHRTYSFSIARTGSPAYLFIGFSIASTEGKKSNFKIARWEYEEDSQNSTDSTCHIDAAVSPYTIGCTGDNDLTAPAMNINLGHINPAVVPGSLIRGGEPTAGPPSYP